MSAHPFLAKAVMAATTLGPRIAIAAANAEHGPADETERRLAGAIALARQLLLDLELAALELALVQRRATANRRGVRHGKEVA
ncbi:MAG: hypothetical protein HXY30_17270 [Pseudorhodoplanes sp.]|nr:hypothetical protein [Pseudorhodoplanes sp.]